MPLLRNIAGVPAVGLVAEGSAEDMMKILPDESGGGGGYTGYYYPVDGSPQNPVDAGGNGGGLQPVDPIRQPVYPIEPILPVGGDDVITQLPVPNQVPVTPAEKPLPLLSLLPLAGAVLAMTDMHPFKGLGKNVLFFGSLALLFFRLNAVDKAAAGGSGIEQPKTL